MLDAAPGLKYKPARPQGRLFPGRDPGPADRHALAHAAGELGANSRFAGEITSFTEPLAYQRRGAFNSACSRSLLAVFLDLSVHARCTRRPLTY
ncbi:hypothetical protein ACVWYH_007809 [Bradyrhizobium sp. GM24.11]